jgi:2-amino-4-hydroxy-6-hydroxymethyldihydropteridine diphosphokinase
MTRAAIALGSNLGDRLSHLRRAVEAIRSLGTVISVSSLYETDPVGGPAQGRYLNAALVVDTELGPEALLSGLQAIEAEAGRARDVHWGPRTLDLDIVAYGGLALDLPGLTVPHPRAAERRFVLAPLAEIAPNTAVRAELTAAAALAATSRWGVFRWDGMWLESQPRLASRGQVLVAAQFVLIVVFALVAMATMVLPAPPWRLGIGLALAAVGGWLAIGASVTLGSSLSALPDPRPDGTRKELGPYRFVRHPIYGGLLAGGAGTAVTLGSWWSLLAVAGLAALLRLKSAFEERALILAYPDYTEYAGRVRHRFIPYVW